LAWKARHPLPPLRPDKVDHLAALMNELLLFLAEVLSTTDLNQWLDIYPGQPPR